MKRLGPAAVFALAATLALAPPTPASAQTVSVQASSAQESYAQSARPRIIIRPRDVRPGPNARRYCRARLVQEYRASGTVIVPQTYCWWQ